MTECSTLYENPHRVFNSYQECQIEAVAKEKWTRNELGDSVLYMQVGCKKTNMVGDQQPKRQQTPNDRLDKDNENSLRNSPTI